MKQKYFKLINGILFITLLFINGWIYVNRNNGYAYQATANYNQLYQLNDLSQWQQKSQYATPKELVATQQIISDSLQINKNESDSIKIKKIAAYLLKNLNDCRGIPIDSMNVISPLNQFNFAIAKKSKVWCGNFSTIFSYFANSAGVLTRAIDIGGSVNSETIAHHSFNEAFIKEINQWVLVDLTSNTLFLKSQTGGFLNTLDFYRAHLTNQQLHTISYKNDSIREIDYKETKPFYNDYFSPNTSFVFYLSTQFDKNLYDFSSKIKRYFSKSPTFFTYSETKPTDNKKFYLKQFYFCVLLLFLVYWIGYTAIIYYRKK
ncbi:MAG: hypothetical protein A3K10_01800 [Bacteroidetes bacterium RIFCSPLOWO2_12_FULL_31_6]|nr:MAG: hypothetical protein A3K10_01800 [Bacteroidetes bacterium RIFCSPLOWO2_12_FULL_31_6]